MKICNNTNHNIVVTDHGKTFILEKNVDTEVSKELKDRLVLMYGKKIKVYDKYWSSHATAPKPQNAGGRGKDKNKDKKNTTEAIEVVETEEKNEVLDGV